MDDTSKKNIAVSPELQMVMREYTKAVLRDRPADILIYSRQYFKERADAVRFEGYKLPPSTSDVFQRLAGDHQVAIEDLFKRFDVDCSGAISYSELQQMVSQVGQLFGFDGEASDVSSLMAMFDSDGDRNISWQEWSHACAEYLQQLNYI